jgi:hypothetical protein
MSKRFLWCVATLSLLLVGVEKSRADVIDFVSTSLSQFGTLDLNTGTFVPIGTDVFFQDLARLPFNTLYGMDNAQTLRIVNPADGSSTIVGVSGNGIQGLAIRSDGTLFGLSHQNLYTIDKTTGAATLVGFMGPFAGDFDAKFDNTGKLLLETNGALYSVNTSTGNATLVGPTPGFTVLSMDFENGTMYGFTTGDQIISINTSTGAGTLLTNTSPATAVFGAAPSGIIPEPSSIILLGMGLVGLMGFVRRGGPLSRLAANRGRESRPSLA